MIRIFEHTISCNFVWLPLIRQLQLPKHVLISKSMSHLLLVGILNLRYSAVCLLLASLK